MSSLVNRSAVSQANPQNILRLGDRYQPTYLQPSSMLLIFAAANIIAPGIFNTAGLEMIPQLASSILRVHPDNVGAVPDNTLLSEQEYNLYLAYFKPIFNDRLAANVDFGTIHKLSFLTVKVTLPHRSLIKRSPSRRTYCC